MENTNVYMQATSTPSKPIKTKGLRMPHEKTWVQAIIVAVVIFCLVFSFLPLFLTVVNSFKLDDQVKVNAFSLPVFSTILEAADINFGQAWEVLAPYYFRTILVALVGAILETIIGALLAYILVVKNFYFKEFIFMLFISAPSAAAKDS